MVIISKQIFCLYNERYEVQIKNSSIPAHNLCCDFTCDFKKEGLNCLNADQATRIRYVLISRGVQINIQRNPQRNTALIACLEIENFLTTSNDQNEDSDSVANATVKEAIYAGTIADTAVQEAKNQASAFLK